MKETLLLEIGVEEVPARFLPGIRAQMAERMGRLMDDLGIPCGTCTGFATPRRLAVIVDDVNVRQEDRRREVLGPPVKAAYDKDGNPTKAAAGFAASQGTEVSSLVRRVTDRGEYVAAVLDIPGRETREVLAEELPGLIRALSFPKAMRWGSGDMRFVRPIHWIVALLGTETVPFRLDGIESGNATRGHRFLSPGAFQVKTASSYGRLLERNYVTLDHEERRERIAARIGELAASAGGRIVEDAGLLAHVSDLVEHPHPVLGRFDDRFLDLPRELPVTVMRDHQKYFALEDSAGHLLPCFITVANGLAEHEDVVRRGNERVLRARLEDARFYYTEDRKQRLADRVEDLRAVTFQEKLGTVFDKVERFTTVAARIAERFDPSPEDRVRRACYLSKADLVSGVVYEFPELQGYIGMVYAGEDGEHETVSRAIGEHYMPRFSGDDVPASDLGAIVALADKIDSIVGFFSVGLVPSGSEDPFALRRQALGIVAILDQKGYDLSVGELIEWSRKAYAVQGRSVDEGVKDDVLGFFRQRLEAVLGGDGFADDAIAAVLAVESELLPVVRKRLGALAGLREDPGFGAFLTASRRALNILNKYEGTPFDEKLLGEASEKALWQALQGVEGAAGLKDPKALFDLAGPIDGFFEGVLVMDERKEIRENRLALLARVRDVLERIADFSKIAD